MLSCPVPIDKGSRFELADKTFPTLNEHQVFLPEKLHADVQAFCE